MRPFPSAPFPPTSYRTPTPPQMKIDAERRGIALSNPYDRGGVIRNCTHLFCAPAPPRSADSLCGGPFTLSRQL